MSIFNRSDWNKLNASLDHKHTFESERGYLIVEGHGGTVTLLRCICGKGQWFFQ